MKSAILTSLAVAAAIAIPVRGLAQEPAIRPPDNHVQVYHHASTLQEGVLRGVADIGRALGKYRYDSSLAMINREVARSRYLDNRVKSVDTYFSRKKINQEYRDSQRRAPATQEDLARLARKNAPQRLTASQYEPLEGTLYWPSVFDRQEFAAERDAIDRLVAARAVEESGVGSVNQDAIQQLTAQMKGKLKAQIRTVSPTQYVQAKNFLSSLEYEAQLPMAVAGIAAR